ncbi:unnamed protein product [Schistocephalus solidus]|uniref:PrcB_C domain-containing protein n=1 Tax=Schistocephalus solidus TaxID=70667 RepID=A0A183T1S4_SCHSO|nr:unnamed protein product [Schistocephalus solidus]
MHPPLVEKMAVHPIGEAGPGVFVTLGVDYHGREHETDEEADQAIVDALWRKGQTSYGVPPGGKGETSVMSLYPWPAASEEVEAGTYLLQLTLLRGSGLAESSNVHFVVR